MTRLNDTRLHESLDAFLQHGNPRIRALDKFNADLKTLEKLFKSYGLASFHVETAQGRGLEWSEFNSRVMYVTQAQNKPLAETDRVTRDAARREGWLQNLLDEAVEELRKTNEDDGDIYDAITLP